MPLGRTSKPSESIAHSTATASHLCRLLIYLPYFTKTSTAMSFASTKYGKENYVIPIIQLSDFFDHSCASFVCSLLIIISDGFAIVNLGTARPCSDNIGSKCFAKSSNMESTFCVHLVHCEGWS